MGQPLKTCSAGFPTKPPSCTNSWHTWPWSYSLRGFPFPLLSGGKISVECLLSCVSFGFPCLKEWTGASDSWARWRWRWLLSATLPSAGARVGGLTRVEGLGIPALEGWCMVTEKAHRVPPGDMKPGPCSQSLLSQRFGQHLIC